MGGDQFDKRWYILAGFAVLAIVIVGIIVVSRSGGGSSSDETKTTASKENGGKEKGAKGCTKVEQPKPRKESLPKPKMTTKKGEEVTAVVETNCGTFDIALATTEA